MSASIFNILSNNITTAVLTISLIVVLSIAWSVLLQTQLWKLQQRQKAIFKGKDNQDLEEVIIEHTQEIEKLDADIEDLYKISDTINKIAMRGIQKVGLVRFNPFKDTGSNQSFALALLDAADNGVVVSSLYTRQETRTYSKPIIAGKSEYQLSEEEKEALKKAIDGK